MDINKIRLEQIVKRLKDDKVYPKKIDLAQKGNIYFSSIYNKANSPIISDNVYCGVDTNPKLSLLKCFSEYIERLASYEGQKKGLPSCLYENSDGFAAYPKVVNLKKYSSRKARENAYFEALERYSWASWWDNDGIKFQIFDLMKDYQLSEETNTLITLINDSTPVHKFMVIVPSITSIEIPSKTIILYANLKSGGWISGGASGVIGNENIIFFRALSEMVRHSLALKKFSEEKIEPFSFYEKRLVYFGHGQGNSLVKKRLEKKGKIILNIPVLDIDEIVPHRYEKIITVYRCYFKNQPPFIGGDLKRFCL